MIEQILIVIITVSALFVIMQPRSATTEEYRQKLVFTISAFLFWMALFFIITARADDFTAYPQKYLDRGVLAGRNACKTFTSATASPDEKKVATYYDCVLAYSYLKEKTGAAEWDACIQQCSDLYSTEVRLWGGRLSGYWNFTRGARKLGIIDVVDLLSHNAMYTGGVDSPPAQPGPDFAREISYALMSFIDGQALGFGPYSRFEAWHEDLLMDLQHYFVFNDARQIKPFMVGLISEALMQYYEEVAPDPRIPAALKFTAAGLWDRFWQETGHGFIYMDRPLPNEDPEGTGVAAPDLNMLIVPLYGWLYKKTGDVTYRDRGDRIFVGGVDHGYIGSAKQFNQNYRTGFRYLEHREGTGIPTPMVTILPSPTPTLQPTATPTPSPTQTAAPIPTRTATPAPTAVVCKRPPGCGPGCRCECRGKNRTNGKTMKYVGEGELCQWRDL